MLGIVLDETDRVEAERELSAYRTRLKMALEAARAGIWTWDSTAGEVQWSPELELIHGLVPGTFKAPSRLRRATSIPTTGTPSSRRWTMRCRTAPRTE